MISFHSVACKLGNDFMLESLYNCQGQLLEAYLDGTLQSKLKKLETKELFVGHKEPLNALKRD